MCDIICTAKIWVASADILVFKILLAWKMYFWYLDFSLQSYFYLLHFFAWEGDVSKQWTFFSFLNLTSYPSNLYYVKK